MIPDFSSFIENTSGAECCLVYSLHFHVCVVTFRLLDVKDVFHVAWVKIIKGLITSGQ